MAQNLLIIYDRNTAGLDGLDEDYDCIYDEFTTFYDLIMNWVSPGKSWKIFIFDAALFKKFKKDFYLIKEQIPQLRDFSDISALYYVINEGHKISVEYPNKTTMNEFERLMEENELWKKIERENW